MYAFINTKNNNKHKCAPLFSCVIITLVNSQSKYWSVSSQGGLKGSVFPKQYSDEPLDYNEALYRHQQCLINQRQHESVKDSMMITSQNCIRKDPKHDWQTARDVLINPPSELQPVDIFCSQIGIYHDVSNKNYEMNHSQRQTGQCASRKQCMTQQKKTTYKNRSNH